MSRFRLEDLNPAMRAQAEAKMRELERAGTVRTNKCQDDADGEGYQKAKAQRAAQESKLERRFSQQLAERLEIPPHQRNYFFLPDRDYEFDFSWPNLKVAVEIQGMAHRVKARFKADIEKRALAMLAGWRVLELDGTAVRSGRGVEWLTQLMAL